MVARQQIRQTIARNIGDRGRDADRVAHLVSPDLLAVAVNRDDESGRGANDKVVTAIAIDVTEGRRNIHMPCWRHVRPGDLLGARVGQPERQPGNPSNAIHD